MFRKIHSNRDPKDTLLSQIQLEFRPFFGRCAKILSQKMKRHPKLIFYGMTVMLLISAGLSFTLFKNADPAGKSNMKKPGVNTVNDGFDQLSRAAAAIRQTIRLKNEIDSLSNKKQLNRHDSITLEKDLDQLRHLQNQQKP